MSELVVYFSKSGNTKALGEKIASELSASTFELNEMKKTGFVGGAFQALTHKSSQLQEMPDLSEVECLYVGGPVWAGSLPPALNAFFESVDLNGIRVRGFSTQKSEEVSKFASEMGRLVKQRGGEWEGLCALQVPKTANESTVGDAARNFLADWKYNAKID